MKKNTKRVLGGLALAAGALGAAGNYLKKKKRMRSKQQRAANQPASVWARPGMTVTFRAELMPGRDREQRTARVKELLPSGRVTLHEVAGEHAQKEFDPVNQ
jgi:plastocyanin